MILTGSLFLTWFFTIDVMKGFTPINAFSTGFEFWVFVTVLVLLGSVAMSIIRPSRIAMVVTAWFGSWWLLLSVAAMTSRDTFIPAVAKFYDLPDLVFANNIFDFAGVRAHEIGEAWYAIALASLLILGGSITMIREAGKYS